MKLLVWKSKIDSSEKLGKMSGIEPQILLEERVMYLSLFSILIVEETLPVKYYLKVSTLLL